MREVWSAHRQRITGSTIIAIIALLLLGNPSPASAAANHENLETKAQSANNANKMKSLGFFKPSFYWIALEKNDGSPRDKQILDMDGNLLAMVSEQFFKELRMEGTGQLLDGRLLNYKGRITLPDGSREIRYRFCGPEAPYGYGFEDIPLVPFRSLAVDTTVIPIGTRIYVPAAKGAVLPSGEIHDGMFFALDIGDAIKNRRIDVFTSFGDQSKVFRDNGMSHMKAVEIFVVE